MSDTNSEAPTNCSYPLKKYLHTVWLPTFRATAAPPLDVSGRAQPWPVFEDLRRKSGTRRLAAISRIDLTSLNRATTNYFDALPNLLFGCNRFEGSIGFMLPNPDVLHIEKSDLRYLTRIDNEEKFRELLEKYVLATISESLRLVHHLAPGVPLAEDLKFRETPQFCSIWRSKWNVLYIPGSPGRFTMAVICLPPWDFGFTDFDEFVRPQRFPQGQLDTLNEAPFTKSCYNLWAAIYDVCAGRGHHFAVTTYDRWSFGQFNNDWSAAQVTQTLTSPIHEFDGRCLYDNGAQSGPNLMEVFTFWIQVSRGATVVGDLGVVDLPRGVSAYL